ncbi:UNVERIFIED_CONTAM: hypothetical protein GTU68_045800 [Idotea baltica]|nr:hypothetical protein [Idotea baltica]
MPLNLFALRANPCWTFCAIVSILSAPKKAVVPATAALAALRSTVDWFVLASCLVRKLKAPLLAPLKV